MRAAHGLGVAGLLLLGLVAINPVKASAFPAASGGIYVAQSDIIPVHRRRYRRYRHYRPYRYYYRPYGYYRPYRYYYGGPGIGLYFRF